MGECFLGAGAAVYEERIAELEAKIRRLRGLLREHACAPVKEEFGWECPICAELERLAEVEDD